MATCLEIFWVILSYLAGSFLPSYVFVKIIKGKDVRELGDRNPGSYNAGKILGKKWGLITGAIDIGKGFLMTLLPFALHMPHSSMIASLSGIAVVLGHAFSIYFRFKGGMAIAPTLGALVVLVYREMIYVLLIWLSLVLLMLVIKQKEKRGIAQFISFLFLIPLEFIYKEKAVSIISTSIILFHLYLRRFILKKTVF